MRNKINKSLPEEGEWIEITDRKCGDKVSPLLQVGGRFIVRGVAELKDGTPVIEVAHPKRKKSILRMNAAKFGWKAITIEALREEQFKKEITEDTSKLITEFSKEEQISIALVPLIFNHIAWTFALKALQISVDNRIGLLKKAGRKVRELRQEYEAMVRKDLDYKHQKHLEEETEQFMDEYRKDFTILYYAVNQEFKRAMPAYPYDDLRTYAILSMLMIRFVDEHNGRMDRLIASRLGSAKASIRMPIMDALHTCMDAFAGETGKFNYADRDITLAMKVIDNDMEKTDFEIL